MGEVKLSFEYSIIVPCSNDGKVLIKNLSRLFHVAEFINAEIIVVDDGSLQPLGHFVTSISPYFQVINHSKNLGQTKAYLSGVVAASTSNLIFFSADFEVSPDKIIDLVSEIQPGIDLINTKRSGRAREVSMLHFMMSRCANSFLNFTNKVHFYDRGSGLKFIRKGVLEDKLIFDGAHRFIPDLVSIVSLNIREVEVSFCGRISGRSSYFLMKKSTEFLINLIQFYLFKVRYEKSLNSF